MDRPVEIDMRGKNYLLNGNARYLAAAPLADMAVVFAQHSEESLSVFTLDTTVDGVTAGRPTDMM